MPRQNKPRHVLAEEYLAQRITAERDSRGWTNDGLAQRMTEVGCPMSGSAIFKIEKGEPRRRIVVDELVAFSKVFKVPIEELLEPPALVHQKEAAALFKEWAKCRDEEDEVDRRTRAAWEALEQWLAAHPEMDDTFAPLLAEWARERGSDVDSTVAFNMLAFTGWSEKWQLLVSEAGPGAWGQLRKGVTDG